MSVFTSFDEGTGSGEIWGGLVDNLLGGQSPLDVLDDALSELLSDEARLLKLLQAVGARLMGGKPRISCLEEWVLPLAAKQLRQKIDQYKSDPTRLANQQAMIKLLDRRKLSTARQLHALAPYEFEHFAAAYFQRRKFRDVWVTKASNDFGVDVEMADRFGRRIVVQCKRYAGKVGRPVVQQTFGAMYMLDARECYVVTSGDFTKEALEVEAAFPNIHLVDGKSLLEVMAPAARAVTSPKVAASDTAPKTQQSKRTRK